ncbi:MAG: DNA polymerase domain-containing protein [Candidatus Nanoarchaeia archaeon]
MSIIHGRIVNQYYEIKYGFPIIVWVIKTLDGQKRVFRTKCKDVLPRAYFPVDIFPLVKKIAEKISDKYTFGDPKEDCYFVDFQDAKVKVVYHPIPKMIKKLRDVVFEKYKYDLYQADIPYVRVYNIEKEIRGYVSLYPSEIDDGIQYYLPTPLKDEKIISKIPELNILYFDLEIDDRYGFKKPTEDDFDSKLLSFSTQHGFYSLTDEHELARLLLNKILFADVLVAHNGDLYDFPALKHIFRRYEDLKEFYNERHYAKIDFMRLFIKRHRDVSATQLYIGLDEIGESFLGIGKIKRKKSFYQMFEDYHNGENNDLEVYNNRDIEIMIKAENEFNFIATQLYMSAYVGLNIGECIEPSRLPDVNILRVSKEKKRRCIFRSKRMIPDLGQYGGAKVLDPKAGFHITVLGFDLVSLYNRIMQTFNISPEMWNPETKTFDKRGNEIGIVPSIIMELEKEREKYKKLRKMATDEKTYKKYDIIQASFKTMILTYYGEIGRNGSRYFNKEIAEEITYRGRNMISGEDILKERCPLRKDTILLHAPKQIVEKDLGFDVLYGDTDSIYVKIGMKLPDDVILKIAKDIQERIQDAYVDYLKKLGVPKERQRIKMEFQGYYGFMCFTEAKKRYVGLLLYDGDKEKWVKPKLYYKGHELVKSSTCKFTKHSQLGLFGLFEKMYMKDEYKEEEIVKFLKRQRSILLSGKINEHLILRKSTKSNLDDYKTTSPHIRAAKKLKEKGKFIDGQRIEFVIVEDGINGLIAEPIEDDNIPEIKKSGLEYYWRNQFFNYVEDTIATLFDVDDIKRQLRGQKSIREFLVLQKNIK